MIGISPSILGRYRDFAPTDIFIHVRFSTDLERHLGPHTPEIALPSYFWGRSVENSQRRNSYHLRHA